VNGAVARVRIGAVLHPGVLSHSRMAPASCSTEIAQSRGALKLAPCPADPIRFCLFTVRHRFIASMKAVLQDDAVSALIGRLIVKTKRAHHTKLRAAWSVYDIEEVPSPPNGR
jgi:hypothetical protein